MVSSGIGMRFPTILESVVSSDSESWGAATQQWDWLVGAQSLVLIMFLQCSESNLICQFNIIFIVIHIYIYIYVQNLI